MYNSDGRPERPANESFPGVQHDRGEGGRQVHAGLPKVPFRQRQNQVEGRVQGAHPQVLEAEAQSRRAHAGALARGRPHVVHHQGQVRLPLRHSGRHHALRRGVHLFAARQNPTHHRGRPRRLHEARRRHQGTTFGLAGPASSGAGSLGISWGKGLREMGWAFGPETRPAPRSCRKWPGLHSLCVFYFRKPAREPFPCPLLPVGAFQRPAFENGP